MHPKILALGAMCVATGSALAQMQCGFEDTGGGNAAPNGCPGCGIPDTLTNIRFTAPMVWYRPGDVAPSDCRSLRQWGCKT